jgi:hypothetical protein
MILGKINSSVQGRADFADLSMSWWKGVRITHFSFSDETGRILARIKEIVTKPHYGSLLLGNLSFGETEIVEPRVQINLTEQLSRQTGKSYQVGLAGVVPAPRLLPIKRVDLVVKDGNLKVSDSNSETVEFSHISSTVKLEPVGKPSDFVVNLEVTDKSRDSRIRASGQVRPKRQTGWRLKGTSGDFIIEVNDLDLGSLGPIFSLGGLELEAEGAVSANLTSQIEDGHIEGLAGTVNGRNLDITGKQLNGDRLRSSVLDVEMEVRGEKDLINIDKMRIHGDWFEAEVSGIVPKTYESLAEFTEPGSAYSLAGSFDCDLAVALSQMPRTLGVREGTQVTSGLLTGKIETPVKAGKKYIHGSARLTGLAGAVDDRAIALSQPVVMETLITSDDAGAKFDKLEVAASFAKISCTGSAKLLVYEAEGDLAKFQSELGQFISTGEYEMAGQFGSKGRVSAGRDKIAVVGTSSVRELRLGSADKVSAVEPKADMDFSVVVEPNESVLDVNFIRVTANLGRVNIENGILPLSKKAKQPMKLAVSAANVDLERVQPFAVLFASFPKDKQLAGIARSDFSVSSKQGTYNVSTDATHVENLKFSSAGKKPFEQKHVSVVGDVEINPADKSVAVKELQLTGPQIKIYRARVSQLRRDGKAVLEGKADYEFDWMAASSYLPEGFSLKGERKGSISFSSEYPAGQTEAILANLSTKTKLGFAEAEYMGMRFGPAEVDVDFQKGVLRVAPFSTTVNRGAFNFAGQADFNQKPTLLEIPKPMQLVKDVEISASITKKILPYLNPFFSDAVVVAGVASFDCERLAVPLGAPLEKLQIIGTVSADNLRLSESSLLSELLTVGGLSLERETLRMRPTRFILWDGFLRYDDMQIDVGDAPFNFKGTIGLDDSLNMTVVLPYTYEGTTVRVDETTTAERITVPIRGTVFDPQVDMEKLLQDQLRDRIIEGLDKLFK